MNMLIKGKPSKLALFVTDAANKMPAEMQHCLSGRSLTKTASEIRTEPDLDTLIRLSRLLVFEYATKMMTSLLSLDQPSLNPAKPSIQKKTDIRSRGTALARSAAWPGQKTAFGSSVTLVGLRRFSTAFKKMFCARLPNCLFFRFATGREFRDSIRPFLRPIYETSSRDL